MPIHPGAIIGTNVFFEDSGLIHIDDGVVIGDNCRIDVFTSLHENVIVGDNVYIHCNSTIVSGVEIGANSIILYGAVIFKNVPVSVETDGRFQNSII